MVPSAGSAADWSFRGTCITSLYGVLQHASKPLGQIPPQQHPLVGYPALTLGLSHVPEMRISGTQTSQFNAFYFRAIQDIM